MKRSMKINQNKLTPDEFNKMIDGVWPRCFISFHRRCEIVYDLDRNVLGGCVEVDDRGNVECYLHS